MFQKKDLFLFTVWNIYHEKSSLLTRFGLNDPKKELAKPHSEIPDIYILENEITNSMEHLWCFNM
jgi:hypothetical protein